MKTMLSINEVRNAIYLDFEGEGKKADGLVPKPHMAGLFRPNPTGKGGNMPVYSLRKNGSQRLMGAQQQRHALHLTTFLLKYYKSLKQEIVSFYIGPCTRL